MKRLAALIFIAALSCNRPLTDSGAAGETCIADSIHTLHHLSTIRSCATNDLLCRADCMAGKAESCIALAYAAEKASDDDAAARYFHRACLFGSANGCTNYAAHIWSEQHSDSQLACARRTFEKACAAKEPFACGMVGRIMLESKSPRIAEGRKFLETACNEVGGFPCRVLAKHLESGKLGAHSPNAIHTLLARACAGGDPDACGEPATASQTFH